MSLYPLRFDPIYRHYLWGGRRLGTLLGRSLESSQPHAESWEIVDHDEDQSVVQAGPLAGKTLHQLVVEYGEALLGSGKDKPEAGRLTSRFPLLIKYLDAAQNLSMQVHPDDAMAVQLDPPDLGKTEAWYVLDAQPGSFIYAGLKPGVDRETLARAIQDGTSDKCVHRFEPVPGDCLYIPAGTIHALGAGVMVAEVQQASDTTFRLFDWNRLGPDGEPRELHVEKGLEAIDFEAGSASPIHVRPGVPNVATRIVESEYFSLSLWQLDAPVSIAGDGHCHVLSVLEGSVMVEGDPAQAPLSCGQTILLPAALPPVSVIPAGGATLLDVQVP